MRRTKYIESRAEQHISCDIMRTAATEWHVGTSWHQHVLHNKQSGIEAVGKRSWLYAQSKSKSLFWQMQKQHFINHLNH